MNKIIYISCPSSAYTGGPLALHQLAYKLSMQNQNVYMLYYPKVKSPVHPNFKKFNLKYTFKMEDDKKNILVIPETKTEVIFKYNNVKIVIWWLSVDNYLKNLGRYKPDSFKGAIKLIFEIIYNFIGNKKFSVNKKSHRNKEILHLAQSKYAFDFLVNFGLSPKNLHCYLLPEFKAKHKGVKKENVILYNPTKGKKITQKLISFCPEFHFLPLTNMTPDEVKDKLLSAKIYIDFGNHPGRDRFPREAVSLGCCIITGTKGAAKNDFDVCIPREYKFNNPIVEKTKIKVLLHDILENFEDHTSNFSDYRKIIEKEEAVFEQEINLFSNL
jgi:hypothetical protein